ncbi:hypothetical protein TeGR_g3395 [Tetraparma gracilis]|uniref:Lysosomal dipeptide transporter MFSD1 n=1 Tax=Tetraparma gracilis TaxID=2962635 RepID=A0ABQ6MJT2_9STRA|nr:hypothetical protein TeGR_g3395 [Tetraparma gracilis]
MQVESSRYRYTILLLNCLLTFGSYYCFDMPSNCKDQIKEQIIDKFTDDSDLYYNYFYLVYSWTNMIMSLCAGLMVDKLGKEKSMYLFVFFCLFGSAVYAGGTAMTNSDPKLQYGVMFFGRFIFGLGGGPITIVQNVYTATHFKSHNLALAFGCTLTVSRVGSVINFSLTPAIYKFIENHISETYALAITLAFGSSLVLISAVSAVLLSRLDNQAVKEKAGPYKNEDTKISKKINLSDVKEFPALYWVLAVCIALFYSIVFPFMANAPTYLEEEKFGLSSTGLRVSSVYGVSMVASVALGAFVDWFGRRTQIAIIGTGLTIPTFYLLGYTTVDPIVSMLMLGVSYSVCAAALWPSVQMLVPLRTSGTANGVATSVQMLGIGICNIVVGKLNDGATFSHQMLFFAGLGAASLATALSMFCADTDRKMYLGKRDEDLSETDEMRSPLITKEELV